MKTSCKSSFRAPSSRSSEAGNAMIYILIAIVLFAALTMIISRQGDNSEGGALDSERSEIAATQIIQTSMQLKQGVDQMRYSGSKPDTLDFVTPDDIKELAPWVLRHRLRLRPEAELEGTTPDETIRAIMDSVEAPRS